MNPSEWEVRGVLNVPKWTRGNKGHACVCLFVVGRGGWEGERDDKCYSSDRKEWTFLAKKAKSLRGTQNPESNKCCT